MHMNRPLLGYREIYFLQIEPAPNWLQGDMWLCDPSSAGTLTAIIERLVNVIGSRESVLPPCPLGRLYWPMISFGEGEQDRHGIIVFALFMCMCVILHKHVKLINLVT